MSNPEYARKPEQRGPLLEAVIAVGRLALLPIKWTIDLLSGGEEAGQHASQSRRYAIERDVRARNG